MTAGPSQQVNGVEPIKTDIPHSPIAQPKFEQVILWLF